MVFRSSENSSNRIPSGSQPPHRFEGFPSALVRNWVTNRVWPNRLPLPIGFSLDTFFTTAYPYNSIPWVNQQAATSRMHPCNRAPVLCRKDSTARAVAGTSSRPHVSPRGKDEVSMLLSPKVLVYVQKWVELVWKSCEWI